MMQRMRRSRVLGWDRNPLRRRTDRIEAMLLAGLIAAFLISGLVLVKGASAGSTATPHGGAAWRQVTAIVQTGPPNVPGKLDGFIWPRGTVQVPAIWTLAGRPHSGRIPVGVRTPPGSGVRIWVSRSGALTGAPVPPDQAGLVAIDLACLFWLLLLVAACVGRDLLDRRRLADWDRAWLTVAQRWTLQG